MNQESIDATPQTPGNLLKAAREENGWSVDEIAKALRMSASQVNAIEADDTEQLHGITYIRGYWSNYAKLLDIDISDSINYHKSRLLEPPSMMTNPQLHTETSSNERKKKNAAILFGVFAVLGCLLLYFLQPSQLPRSTPVFDNTDNNASQLQNANMTESVSEGGNVNNIADENKAENRLSALVSSLKRDQQVSETSSALEKTSDEDQLNSGAMSIEEGASAQNVDGQKNNALDSNTNAEPDNNSGTDASSSLENANNQNDQSLPSLSEKNMSNEAIQQTVQEDITDGDSNTDRQVIENDRSEADNDNANLSNAPEVVQLNQDDAPDLQSEAVDQQPQLEQSQIVSRTSADAPDTVVFYNTQTSWFDVRDGLGNILVYEDIPANQVLSLKGRPPFYVYSTNAKTLTIAYQGKIFPHKSQVVDNSIRLKISQ